MIWEGRKLVVRIVRPGLHKMKTLKLRTKAHLKVDATLRQGRVTHLIVFWLKPGARKVQCSLRPNVLISSKIASVDEHKPIMPVLKGMRGWDTGTESET